MKRLLTKAMFRTWPFGFGHVSLMKRLNPPQLPRGDASITIRRYGLRFQYDPTTYIGSFLHHFGIFEPQILEAIESHLKPGMTFVDVGANIGLHTVVASKLVGPTGKVISFEPGSPMRTRLLRNIEINLQRNIEVRPFALGRDDTQGNLYIPNALNDGQSSLAKPDDDCRSEAVEIRTLNDQMYSADVTKGCVIKIDVEGAEMEVLRGAGRFIRDARPRAIFVECIDKYLRKFGASRDEVFQWLHQAGYDTLTLRRGSWVSTTEPVDCDIMAIPR